MSASVHHGNDDGAVRVHSEIDPIGKLSHDRASRSVAKLPAYIVPGNGGSRLCHVLCPTPIELGALLRSELQIGVALFVGETLPKRDRELGAVAGRQLQ